MAVCAGEAGRDERKLVAPLSGEDGALRWILYFRASGRGRAGKIHGFAVGHHPASTIMRGAATRG